MAGHVQLSMTTVYCLLNATVSRHIVIDKRNGTWKIARYRYMKYILTGVVETDARNSMSIYNRWINKEISIKWLNVT